MTASTATSITSNANNGTRENTLTFANYNGRQMAITNMIVAMFQRNIIARTTVIPYLFNNTLHHGIGRFILRTKIQTIVP